MERILVTGGTGFIATHIIQRLLSAGYRVRATVRDKQSKKSETLPRLCPSMNHNLEMVNADLLREQDWKEAVKGCDVVLHTASPLPLSTLSSEEEVVKPAVEGTLNVLKACSTVSGVRRVVLTSSVAAVIGPNNAENGKTYNETDWFDGVSGVDNYAKGKVMAERAAWDYVNSGKGSFELVAIQPSLVCGPLLTDEPSFSQDIVKNWIEMTSRIVPQLNLLAVDVRDVADAHIRAINKDGVHGRRFILAPNFFSIWEVIEFFKHEFPNVTNRGRRFRTPVFLFRFLAKFIPELMCYEFYNGLEYDYDCSPAALVLGLRFRKKEESFRDMVRSMIDLGILNEKKD